MTFEEVLDQALSMLHRRQRVTYQTFKLQFELDDERLEALKDALLFARAEISDEDDRGLVWTGDIPNSAPNPRPETEKEKLVVRLSANHYT